MEHWRASFDTGFATGDWEPMRALCAPDLFFDDRRRLALLSGDRELMIASARERAAMGARPELRLVGTAGDRIALERLLWSGGPRDRRFEVEYLGVVEVDAKGLLTAIILLDPDDARGAQREAWSRWAAIDPSSAPVTTALGEMIDKFNAGGFVGGSLANEFVVEDHRHAGMGRLVGAEAYAESIAALRDLAPDSTIESGWHWLALERHGAITVMRRIGTLREGGAYEVEHLFLLTVARGRVTRLEFFELDAADAAIARFEELCAAIET